MRELRTHMCLFPNDRDCDNPNEQDTTSTNFNPDSNSNQASSSYCESDSNGNFGRATDAYIAEIIYQYQVQTTLDLTAQDLNSFVLASLEKTLSDLLVPSLWEGVVCESRLLLLKQITTGSSFTTTNNNNNNNQGGKNNNKKGYDDDFKDNDNDDDDGGGETQEVPPNGGGEDSDLTGLQSAPVDQLAPGVEGLQCRTPLVDGADRCFVINGGLTLVGQKDISGTVPQTLDLVQYAMDMGMLDEVNKDIVEVRYLNAGIVNISPTDPPTQGGDDDNDDVFENLGTAPPAGDDYLGNGGNGTGDGDGIVTNPTVPGGPPQGSTSTEAWPWVILAGGLFVLIAAVVLAQRRRRRGGGADDFEEVSRLTGPQDSMLAMEESSDAAYMQDEPVPEMDVQRRISENPLILPALSSSSDIENNDNNTPPQFEDGYDGDFDVRKRHFV